MRYNRASLADTIRAARARYQHPGYGWTLYIFATAYGYTISTSPPPRSQSHVVVYPDGTAVTQHPLDALIAESDREHIDQPTLF